LLEHPAAGVVDRPVRGVQASSTSRTRTSTCAVYTISRGSPGTCACARSTVGAVVSLADAGFPLAARPPLDSSRAAGAAALASPSSLRSLAQPARTTTVSTVRKEVARRRRARGRCNMDVETTAGGCSVPSAYDSGAE
jgi:hypothetical protein